MITKNITVKKLYKKEGFVRTPDSPARTSMMGDGVSESVCLNSVGNRQKNTRITTWMFSVVFYQTLKRKLTNEW